MSTAIITPQSDGSAIFELNGITHRFDRFTDALAETYARRLRCIVERFPNPAETTETT